MKRCLLLLAVLSLSVNFVSADTRLVILADMGNEPDEMQQMAHMLVCSNEFELEGLIAVTGKFLRPEHRKEEKRRVRPDLFLELIDAYEKARPNLIQHAEGWPEAAYLRSIVRPGQSGYGIRDVGEGKASPGSELLIEVLKKEDGRPIWVVVNAGSNTLAQALYDLRASSTANALRKYVAKLRVYENGSQDNAGAWIASEFPEIHWIRSNYQTYAYGGPGEKAGDVRRGLGPYQWKPYEYSAAGQHAWTAEHVQNNHGPLGEAYPDRRFRADGPLAFIEGGGTIPWMGLVNKGLFDIDQPHWGGWSGRFTEEKVACFWSRHGDIRPDEELVAPFYTYREASDYWVDPQDGEEYQGDYVPIWRFRPAMYSDFRARMDWCVEDYEGANHHPIAVVDGDASDEIIRLQVSPGEELSFDATGSRDPDGNDLDFSWWIYEEAGSYSGRIILDTSEEGKVRLNVPTGARDDDIHLILEIADRHPEVSLTDYRRIVIDVSSREKWSDSPQNRKEGRFDLMPFERK